MIQKIITIPNPILRQKAQPIVNFDKKLTVLIRDLQDTLEAASKPKGIGLSAPQIGISKKVLIITIGREDLTVINPEIIFLSEKKQSENVPKDKQFFEGCLSVPGYWGFVDRPDKVKIKYQDKNGQSLEKEFINKDASLFLHEYDHLEGILFIDRIISQKGKIYQTQKNRQGEEEMVEINL